MKDNAIQGVFERYGLLSNVAVAKHLVRMGLKDNDDTRRRIKIQCILFRSNLIQELNELRELNNRKEELRDKNGKRKTYRYAGIVLFRRMLEIDTILLSDAEQAPSQPLEAPQKLVDAREGKRAGAGLIGA